MEELMVPLMKVGEITQFRCHESLDPKTLPRGDPRAMVRLVVFEEVASPLEVIVYLHKANP